MEIFKALHSTICQLECRHSAAESMSPEEGSLPARRILASDHSRCIAGQRAMSRTANSFASTLTHKPFRAVVRSCKLQAKVSDYEGTQPSLAVKRSAPVHTCSRCGKDESGCIHTSRFHKA